MTAGATTDGNPFAARLDAFVRKLSRRKLDAAVVFGEANVRALTGIACDNACLLIRCSTRRSPSTIHHPLSSVHHPLSTILYTDFRYAAAIRREAPWLRVGDLKRLELAGRRIGCEFTLPHDRFERLRKTCPKAKFVDVSETLADLRAVKTPDEIAKIREAERITCGIWRDASARFRAGMTELGMARMIRKMMIDRADGESFETIVCIGANAAECHHVPDGTVWNGRDPILVDMGVKFAGYCADLTRNVRPKRASASYRRAYELVERANRAAIAALKPGMTAGALDRVARKVIADGGFGKCFGHSLGHGVGLEIHEAPTARKGSKTVLKPGMLVTVEPGIYLEGNLGVRIEDLVLVTETGCEVLSQT